MPDHELDEDDYDKIRKYEDFSTIGRSYTKLARAILTVIAPTLDWIQDSLIERNRRLRDARNHQHGLQAQNGRLTSKLIAIQAKKLLIASQSWVVLSIVGALIGINAALISIVTEWLSDLKMGYCRDGWWLNQEFCCLEIPVNDGEPCQTWRPWSQVEVGMWLIYVLFAFVFAIVSAHLVRTFALYAAGSGIPEIKCIISGFIIQGYLSAKIWFIKSLTLPLVIASGLSVGKEGPSVHVACCIGNVVARMFSHYSRSQGKMREILTAASAAGVGVAFGSPIGGVLFSIEEMTSTFSVRTMWRSFFCALVATAALFFMNPFRTEKLVLFQVTYDRTWHFFEVVFFVIIGIFGGLYGAFVIKFNLQVQAFRRKHLANHAIVEATVLATITAVTCYFNMFLRIDMTESLAILFRECDGGGDYENLCQTGQQWRMVNSLLLATIIRTGFVIISYGCQVPAGIFIPSMAVGATFGRMVGIIVKAMYRAAGPSGMFAVCDPDVPCITPGTYAFLGAAAALGGVTRITVSVVVIMFELTGALTYILPTMIVLMVTKAVGDWFAHGGIADQMIRFNGYPYLDENEKHQVETPVSRVMLQDLYTLPVQGMSIEELEAFLDKATVQGFPIISAEADNLLIGYIERNELLYVLDKARRTRDVTPRTKCSFAPKRNPGQDNEPDLRALQAQSESYLPAMGTLPAGGGMGIEEGEVVELIESSAIQEDDVLHLWPWVNQTPITVSPHMSLEIVMQLFKRMGPRVILVEQYGSLVGLVTVKDVLRFNAMAMSDEPLSPDQSMWESGALSNALEETWLWFQRRVDAVVVRTRNLLPR